MASSNLNDRPDYRGIGFVYPASRKVFQSRR
jgi:hypothetical protein